MIVETTRRLRPGQEGQVSRPEQNEIVWLPGQSFTKQAAASGCIVGDIVGEDCFFCLVEFEGGVVHGIDPFGLHGAGNQQAPRDGLGSC